MYSADRGLDESQLSRIWNVKSRGFRKGSSDLIPKTKSPLTQRAFVKRCQFEKSGAGEGIRTLDPDLGKVVLYH
jgi:hypothetical protein